MITYLKMKRNQWKVKAALYGAAAAFLENRAETLGFLRKMYLALKDVPADELQKALMAELARTVRPEE